MPSNLDSPWIIEKVKLWVKLCPAIVDYAGQKTMENMKRLCKEELELRKRGTYTALPKICQRI